MKLLRYGPSGQEKPGILDADGAIRDLSGVVKTWTEALSAREPEENREADVSSLPKVEGDPRIGSCVARPGKIVCIGLNYSDHAAETGRPSAGTDRVHESDQRPQRSERRDPHPTRLTQDRLGSRVGSGDRQTAKYVDEADALNHVAGYCVANDVSEREFQAERAGQWTKGKSCDTFGPIGPWLVTTDELSDPQNLDMFLNVNGKRMQTGSTNTMIFSVAHIVHYVSQMFSLEAGDVIMTGTPPGVGMGMKPEPVYLKDGDEMHLGIAGLGEQHQKCAADR